MGPAFLAALVALTPVTVARDRRQAVACPAGTPILVLHRYGDLTVEGDGDDSLILFATVRATAEDEEVAALVADSMIDIVLGSRGETLLVATSYPRDLEPGPDLSYEVDIDMVVPARTFVAATNAFGDLVVNGVLGGCRLDSRFGNVELEETRDCEVTSRHGDVSVSQNDGQLVVRSSYGDVMLDEVSDRVNVEHRYGDLETDGVDGVVYLVNRLGRVVTRHSTGRLMVVNHYGDVEAWVEDSGLAELEVMTERGRVDINLAGQIPWQLGGRTVQGLIRSALPLDVRDCNEGVEVTGVRGTGGPRIGLIGSGADFFIQVVEPDEDTPGR